ncbi:MAG: FecR domain-containing protein [Prevotellaceae bacterium]|jgi:ferric-dicitrate binding protein FerR (iron transport regulator)|nr:FecR domain-containing protein [Prevotellaceae bacterium]
MDKKEKEEKIYRLLERMDNDFARMSEESVLPDNEIPSDRILAKIRRRIRSRRIRQWSLRVAAVLIPLILLAGFYTYVNMRVPLFNSGEMSELVVPYGEHLQFVFQDGSHAYLEPGTTLSYPKNFQVGERRVSLKGAGYFVVEKNRKRPFIVEVDGGQVRVTGTSFELNAWPDKREVKLTLEEGSLDFKTLFDKKYPLHPGDRMVYDKISHDCNITGEGETHSLYAWKNNIISFNDTPLTEVLEKLERWYSYGFVVSDERVRQYSFTFAANGSLEDVLQEMAKIAPVGFTVSDGKTVTVRMKK